MRLPPCPTSTQVLRAYEVVLPAHGKSVQDDSHYYCQVRPSTVAPLPITALTASSHRTQVLQWSLSASTYYAWRECLVAAFASTPAPASPTASSTSACTPKPPPQPTPSPGPLSAVAAWPVHPPPTPSLAPPLATSHGSAALLSDGGGGDFLASRSKRPFGCLSDGRPLPPSPPSPPSPLQPPPPPPPPDRPASPNGHSSGSWRSRGPSSPPERPLGPKGAGREAGREVAWEALGLEAWSFASACDRPFGAGHCPSDLAVVPPRQRLPSHHYSPPPPARSRSPLRPSSPHRSTSPTAYRVRVGGGYLYGDHPLPPRRIGESCRRQQVDLVRGSRARQGAREGSTRRLVSVPVHSPESRKSEGPRPLTALTLAAPALP